MDDFEPAKVAEQIPALKELLDMRGRLSELLGKMEGNDKLEQLLSEVLDNSEKAALLAGEMGVETDDPGGGRRRRRRYPLKTRRSSRCLVDAGSRRVKSRWPRAPDTQTRNTFIYVGGGS